MSVLITTADGCCDRIEVFFFGGGRPQHIFRGPSESHHKFFIPMDATAWLRAIGIKNALNVLKDEMP